MNPEFGFKAFLLFILFRVLEKIFGKFISDNLPDMSLKNIWMMVIKVVRHVSLILAAVFPYLALKLRLVKQLNPKTELMMGLAAMIILLTYVLNTKKALTNLKAG